MTRNRYDETWHRLREWTKGQTPSERLAAQLLLHEGFCDLDPSHPLGGRDGGKDATARKNGVSYTMAVYFPRGQKGFTEIKTKFSNDVAGARRESMDGIAFVTNQEMTLGEREQLSSLAPTMQVELFHLERITTILDAHDMVNTRRQFLDIGSDDEPVIHLGGHGGTSPGAGGGGGGAIGRNARGGQGGIGGNVTDLGSLSTIVDYLPYVPGSGGAGAGATGDGAIGGDGGGGGDIVSFKLEGEDLKRVHHMSVQVGKGGVGGPGEDTVLNVCDQEGNILRSVVARGGIAGAPPHVPPPSRLPTEQDLQAGLRVTGMLAGRFFLNRNGLWTIVEGGWDWYKVDTNPFLVELPLFIEIQTGLIDPESVLRLKLVILSPDHFQVHEQEQLVAVESTLVRRTRVATLLRLSGSTAGVWHVQVLAGQQVIGDFPIEIRI
jgi:hypothetical protein